MAKMCQKICEECNVEFTAIKKQRFCSYKCSKTGSRNPAWKGIDAERKNVQSIHTWIERRFPRPICCSKCNKEGKVDLANISQDYKRDVTDWEWLCRKCHMVSDGRLERFLSHSQKRRIPERNCLKCSKEFKPFNAKGKFCSKSCSASYNNLHLRDYSLRSTKEEKATKFYNTLKELIEAN